MNEEIKKLTPEQQQLVVDNLDLVDKMLNLYHIKENDKSDWWDLAVIGLCQAAMNYDPSRVKHSKPKFQAYAVMCIKGQLYKERSKAYCRNGKTSVFNFNDTNFTEIIDNRYNMENEDLIMDSNFNIEKFKKYLTPTETKIVNGLVNDKAQFEIAKELGVSRQYINQQVKSIKNKWIKYIDADCEKLLNK